MFGGFYSQFLKIRNMIYEYLFYIHPINLVTILFTMNEYIVQNIFIILKQIKYACYTVELGYNETSAITRTFKSPVFLLYI